MSTPAVQLPHTTSLDEFHERLLASSAPRAAVHPPSRAPHIRRRATLIQGRALESLGHAVEYLIDSAMFDPSHSDSGNQAAIQILMRASRAVFEECAEILPLRRRLRHWGHRMVTRALGHRARPAVPPC